MANHFNLSGHSLDGNLRILSFEQSPILGSKPETDVLNIEREPSWIRTIESKKSFGNNVEF